MEVGGNSFTGVPAFICVYMMSLQNLLRAHQLHLTYQKLLLCSAWRCSAAQLGVFSLDPQPVCCFAQQSLTVTWLLAAVFVLRLPRVSVAWWFKCLQSLCSQHPLWKRVFSTPSVLLLLQCLHVPLVCAHRPHPRPPLMERLVPKWSDISGRLTTGSERHNHL